MTRRPAPAMARRAEAAGVRLVTVHGRTRCQFFKGRADWARVRPVVGAVSVPGIVNGDISSVGEAEVALNARYFDALALLAANAGQLVSKDRFLDEVWKP